MKEHVNGNGSHYDGKMRESVNGNGSHADTHLARRMMVAYLTGACSSEEREIVEDHCVDCQTCCAQLAAMLHLVISSAHEREDKRRELDALLPLGEHAAARARNIVRRQEQWDPQIVSPWANLWKGLQIFRPVLAPALVVVALLGGGFITYLSLWGKSAEERTLARVRAVYRDARV